MKSMYHTFLLALMVLLGLGLNTLLYADVEVAFTESAPKDRFVIKNVGKCDFADIILDIDLSASVGKLFFDTTNFGEGFEVFQPFEVAQGRVKFNINEGARSFVSDGDVELSVAIASLLVNESVSFTIDVDDRLQTSELGRIRVTGSEIKNSVVRFYRQGNLQIATFGSDRTARILVDGCSAP